VQASLGRWSGNQVGKPCVVVNASNTADTLAVGHTTWVENQLCEVELDFQSGSRPVQSGDLIQLSESVWRSQE
jgi:hypothetical protein